MLDQTPERKRLTNIEKILEGLSPEKRILLEKKLKDEGSKFGVFPLSYAQQRLWFIEQLRPNTTAYNIPSAIRLTGKLNFDALQKSLTQIIKRHEVLRTYITLIDETPMQIVDKNLEATIIKVDISNEAGNQQDNKIQEIIKKEITTPFNLSKLPLFRITLISLNENENILSLVMHHIISDGWSAGIFINELSQFYLAYSKNIEFNFTPLKIQYADFAKWQKKWLEGKIKEKQLTYWREQLKDISVLELPIDFTRPKIQSFEGGLAKGEFDKESAVKLKEISQEKGATLFMSLLAAFNILLYKYSGQIDFAVGTPIANRNNKQIENLIGFFVNTLALKADIDPNLTFTEYLEKFKETLLSAFSNQDLPFEMIIEELQPERDMSHTPIFQVMFTFQNKSNVELRLNDIKLNPIELESTIAKYDLSLNISEIKNGELLIGLEYNKDIFTEKTATNIKDYYKKIVYEIIKNPSVKIKHISLLDNDEKKVVLTHWNQTQNNYPFDKTILDYFNEQVKINPNAIALELDDNQLTYSELNKKVNQLANYLTAQEKVKGKFVALLLERSFEMVISILAVIKSGGAYLPLDTEQPSDIINYILSDANVLTIITHKKYHNKINNNNVNVFLIDAHWEKINKEDKNIFTYNVSPESITYCIYTSGSTGKPKGTLLHHKGLLNRILWMKEAINSSNKDIFLQKTPYTFDVSVWEFFLPLTIGAKLVIAKPEGHKDPFYLQSLINEKKVSIIHFVPSMLRVFLDTPEVSECKSLKNIICSGEALPVEIQNDCLRLLKSNLFNFYGPTEATVDVTYWKCKEKLKYSHVPIGKPIANTQVYILDNFQNPVPVGIPGELYIGGINLAYGYLNKPELTAEKFIPNNFSLYHGERLYKTGDLVKYLPDGNIVFLSRIDYQVKLRGLRIELGEIESEIRENDFVNDALVNIYSDDYNNQYLIAYVVTSSKNVDDNTEKIKGKLTKSLPEYMIPTFYIYLDKFPLTTSGKINRKLLPLPDNKIKPSNKEIVLPTSEAESILVSLISDLLNIDEISIDDNFFAIGGHSLLATQLLIRIKKKLSIDIPLKYIFEKPVIKNFAKVVDEYLRKSKKSDEMQIEIISRNKTLHLSYQQQRLWFLDQLDPNNSVYNIPTAVKIKGKLNIKLFENSLNYIIQRHEILRTSIQESEGKAYRKIHADYKINLNNIDYSNIPEDNKDYKILDKIREEASKPFLLSQVPLLRTTLLKIDVDEYVFILTMHHIISDGWSSGIFVNEFSQIYTALLHNQQINLPPLKIQYADYSYWQRNWLQGEILEKYVDFWKKQLDGIPPVINLPTDRPRPAVQTFNGAIKQFKFSKEVSEKLSVIAKENNATLFMVLLTTFQTLLSKYSGQDDICIGTPVANRNRSEIENLIGFFVNTVVIRTDLSGDPSFTSLLKKVKNASVEAFAHQDLPFEKLVDVLNIERNVSHSPIFQVMFSFQNFIKQNISLPGISLEQIELDSKNAKFDINITMSESINGQLVGAFEYNTDLFESATIDRLINHFSLLTNAICDDYERPISKIEFISVPEKHLLNEWNTTKYDNSRVNLLHELFEKTVKKKPNDIAVIYGENALTFYELESKANQLAHYLLKQNYDIETVVGVCLNRSVEMMISIIAIWKAGCVYVPIDPELPEDRIRHIIKDSKAKIIISTGNIYNKYQAIIPDKILIDEQWKIIENEPQNKLLVTINSSNLAYIIYTSGSTGNPKGVMVEHHSVINLANELNRKIYNSKNSYIISLNAPISFDASVQQIVMMLSGNTLNIIPQEIRLDDEALVNYITKHKIEILDCVPTQLTMMIDNNLLTNEKWKPKIILPGGEAINGNVWEMLIKNEEINFFNMYGPTECTVDSTICEITKYVDKPSIGRPINNNTHFVLDKKLQIVPIGVAGELYIGGEGLSRGYLNNPSLTAEYFIPNPFSDNKGERLYKTGDLVRYLSDGNIEYLGRIDNQVKLRGFRIELGEIEHLLKDHPLVKEAVVVIREDTPNVKRLIAYCTTIEEKTLSTFKLRDHLTQKLPSYMIPAQIIQLEKLPLTPSGKINRKGLPKPEAEKIDVNTEYKKPTTENEIILAEAIQQVLNIKKVGIHDNFFELGGDSIIGIQVISKVKQAGLNITPVQLFQHQTIHKLAAVATKVKIIKAEQGIVTGSFDFIPIQKLFVEKNTVIEIIGINPYYSK